MLAPARCRCIARRRFTANVGSALESVVHLEYFHDHVRIEEMLFDGVPQPVGGTLRANDDAPGIGVEFRWADAARFAV